MALSSVHATFLCGASLLRKSDAMRSFTLCLPFSSMATSVSTDHLSRKKWRRPVVSALELGGVKVSREGIQIFVDVFISVILLVNDIPRDLVNDRTQ